VDEIVYMTANQIITINTVKIRIYSPGEPMVVKDPNLLDSAINLPKQSVFGSDAYPTIHEEAASLFESIAKNHAFHNANKRTALASLIFF
jgi:death-on-curing protein